MLHNIFNTKNKENNRITKNISQPFPRIVIDTREKNSLVISNLIGKAEIELKTLEIGDYLIGNTIIERKTFSDFISSMLNRRLIEQLHQMQSYENRILILEGKDFEQLEKKEIKLNPNAIRGMILSISLDFKIPIIFTKDSEDTAKFLIVLAKQQLKKNQIEFTLHSRKPQTISEQKQYIIESFPNIGPKTAKALLKKFKTLNKIFKASEEELKENLRNKAKDFRNILSN